jgi:hypothetical protein
MIQRALWDDAPGVRLDMDSFARLGQLTKTDRLWTLLVEKEQELLDAELADLRQLGEGSAK